MNWTKNNYKGIALCLAIATPAWFLGRLVPIVGGPVFSILIGIAVSMVIKNKQNLSAGVSFSSKKLLQYAIILLGFGLNLSVIAQTGLKSLPIIISTISISLITAFAMFKIMKVPAKISVLIGVGSSICGGSAIAATAPVIDASDEDIAHSISVVFLFNIIAALIFPAIGGLIGLSDYGFGLFAGTAINDTSSVTAASSAWDSLHGGNALDTATIVKLTRTLAIIPITLSIALYRAIKDKKAGSKKVNLKKIFPTFILFFVLASLVATICTWLGVPKDIFSHLKVLSKFLIIIAMAAIGFNTDIKKLIKNGGKAIIIGLVCWVSISVVSLLIQQVIGIW